MQLRQFLEQRYPHLIGNIDGMNYPPKPLNAFIAQTVGMLQMFGMLFLFAGEFIAGMIGMPLSNEAKAYLSENKMMLFMCLFPCNGFAQSLIATGAFEVEFNDVVVFSKLETGRMPRLDELLQGLHGAGLKEYQAGAN